MKLVKQCKLRKDSVISELYYQCKLSGFNIKVAYRDYDIRRNIIDAVIYDNDETIICFILYHPGYKYEKLGGIPTFRLDNIYQIPNVISNIKKLIS